MQGQPTALTEITETSGGRVARVTVNRPEKLNALDRPALAALHDAFAGLAADPDLRVAVLTGAGARAFIGGADIAMLNGLDPAGARSMIEAVHGVCQAIRDLPVPVIARVNGWCLGAGLEIAAACDLRLASEGAMFGMPEVRVGLPSVVEAALLPRLVGWGKARELVYLGRNYDAKEAEAMGLVERVTTQSGLQYRDIKVGDGVQPEIGFQVGKFILILVWAIGLTSCCFCSQSSITSRKTSKDWCVDFYFRMRNWSSDAVFI